MMTSTKEPKVRNGRIARIVQLPIGLHDRIKALAKVQSLPVSHLYDNVISGFIEEHQIFDKSIDYLFHKGSVEKVAIRLKKDVVYSVKSLVGSDSVSENRALFTAIVRFSKNNSLLTD